MSQYHGPMSNKVLEEATQRLRDSHGIEMPPALIPSTVAAIRNRPLPVARRRTGRGLALRLASLAATFLLAFAGVAAVMMHGGTRVALAQVLDKVKNSDSVEFVLVPGQEDSSSKQQKCILQGKMARAEHPTGIVMIADMETRQGLYLDPENKTAGRFTLSEHSATEFATDPIEQLRQVRTDDAERLRKEVVDDKEAEVFRVRGIRLFGTESDKGEMRVWVDTTTMLPLRIELRVGATPVVTLKEIKWNSAIDPSLLSLAIPDSFSEQPAEVFRRVLQPEPDADKALTPTEAFRKWRGADR